MRAARTARLVILAAALLAWAVPVLATDDAGLRSVFARGAGERALALGGAYGALADDATAPFWNPAGLGHVERTVFQASHTDLIGMGFYEQYGSVAVPSWRLGTFAVSLRRFGVDGIEGRDDRGGLTDANLEDSESELGFAYGRSLGEAWNVGAAFKYQQQSVAGFKGSGVGLDVGVQTRPFLAAGALSPLARSVRVGLTLRNIVEPNIRLLDEDVPDPMSLRLGSAAALRLGQRGQLRAAVDVEKTRDMDAVLQAGLELELMELLALRTGTSDGTLAAGVGVRWRQFAVDYAFEDNEIEPVHRFGLGVAFGPTTDERRLAAQDRVEQELNARLNSAFRKGNERRNENVVRGIQAALKDGDGERALERVRALRVLAPSHADADGFEARALQLQGATAEAQGDLAGAALAYQRCLRVDPEHAAARAALARVNAESDRRTRRSQELRDLYDTGLGAYAAGDLEAARVAFARITELAPDEHEATKLLRHTEQALSDRRQAEIARAEAAAAMTRARAAAAPPTRPTPSAGAATPSVPAAPTPTYTSLPLKRRAEIADLYRRGVESAEAGRRQDAIRYWELVWSAAPDYRQVGEHLKQEYLAQGMEAFAAGRLDQAIGIWEKALAVAPDDPRTNGYLERAYEHKARIRALRSNE